MLQAGRNLIDAKSGAMCGKAYLILDRDTNYTDQFRRLIRQWDERHSATTTITKPECICGAICSLDQVRMPGSDDLHRAGVVASRRDRIPGLLPLGTKSSGTGQSIGPGGAELRTRSWDGPPAAETRRDAQFILPRSGVTGPNRTIGQYGRDSIPSSRARYHASRTESSVRVRYAGAPTDRLTPAPVIPGPVEPRLDDNDGRGNHDCRRTISRSGVSNGHDRTPTQRCDK
jgi:hypothetical protein